MKEVKRQIYNDVWFLYKKYIGAISDNEWESLLVEEEKLLKKHGNDPFLKDLIYALNNEFGRK